MRYPGSIFVACLLGGLAAPASAAQWDIDTDFATINAAGSAWEAGYLRVEGFYRFDIHTISDLDAWSSPSATGAQAWQSLRGYFDFGIPAGGVSLDSDDGTPMIRWTSPHGGGYVVDVVVGGSTRRGPNGFGNANASLSGLRIGRSEIEGIYDPGTNLKSWHFSNLQLTQGAKLGVYVNEHYGGGNTQLKMSISPAGIGGKVFGSAAKNVTCKNLTTAQVVVIHLDEAARWNCSTSGLLVNPGDVIDETIRSVAY